jgi:transposase InsO family protein
MSTLARTICCIWISRNWAALAASATAFATADGSTSTWPSTIIRAAFSQVAGNEKGVSAATFLKAALAWYAKLGMGVRRLLTDSGPCYKSRAFRAVCQQHGIKHIPTRLYAPHTNGKAERFIQTALRE